MLSKTNFIANIRSPGIPVVALQTLSVAPVLWYKLQSASDVSGGYLYNSANSTYDATSYSLLDSSIKKYGSYSLSNLGGAYNANTYSRLPTIAGSSAMSICYWWYLTTNNSASTFNLCATSTLGNYQIMTATDGSSSTNYNQIRITGSSNNPYINWATFQTLTGKFNTWIHLCFVISGTSLKVYENNVNTYNFTLSSALPAVTRTSNYLSSDFYNGKTDPNETSHIQDFRIFNGALNATDINYIYLGTG